MSLCLSEELSIARNREGAAPTCGALWLHQSSAHTHIHTSHTFNARARACAATIAATGWLLVKSAQPHSLNMCVCGSCVYGSVLLSMLSVASVCCKRSQRVRFSNVHDPHHIICTRISHALTLPHTQRTCISNALTHAARFWFGWRFRRVHHILNVNAIVIAERERPRSISTFKQIHTRTHSNALNSNHQHYIHYFGASGAARRRVPRTEFTYSIDTHAHCTHVLHALTHACSPLIMRLLEII